ncbi:MAG: phage tail sheath C-terminal domain-containing protein [Pseudomonadota bacterium]
MTLLTRPGIYQRPVRPSRRVGGLARRDIPVFIGFTQRGPTVPVRVESVAQFEGVFGAPVETSYMTAALRGFFETGGQAAYILRLVGPDAVPASAVAGTWTFSARTRTADLLTRRAGEALAQWQENLSRTYPRVIPDPGGWANGLSVHITVRQGRSVTAHVDADDLISLKDLAGLEDGAVLTVSAGGSSEAATVLRVDALRRQVRLAGVTALPVGQIRLSEALIDIEIWRGVDRLERFEGTSPGPESPRYFAEVLNASSRLITAIGGGDAPVAGAYGLVGGKDGLRDLSAADWHAALPLQAQIDEIALIAAPDLVRADDLIQEDDVTAPPAQDFCHLPDARPTAAIAAVLVDAETGEQVEGARVDAAGEGQVAFSDAVGAFRLESLPPELIELRISKEGYLPGNPLVQATETPNTGDLLVIPLVARADIPVLRRDEIIAVQRAMQDSATVGAFRVAVLDPPGAGDTPDELLSWTGRVGGTARGFAVAPWIGSGPSAVLVPPSGHVCGAFAAAELGQGVHRAPGNTVLRQAKTVPLAVSDTVAADFLDAGLNLIEATAGRGIRLMGGRTLSRSPDWRQVSVRRLFDAIERTLLSRLTWAVFEPGNALTRQVLKFSMEQFLERLRLRGMFAGSSAAEAYSVICDDSVNTAAGQARGELVVEIAIAPTQPYEFITFSLAAQQEAIDVTEGS